MQCPEAQSATKALLSNCSQGYEVVRRPTERSPVERGTSEKLGEGPRGWREAGQWRCDDEALGHYSICEATAWDSSVIVPDIVILLRMVEMCV